MIEIYNIKIIANESSRRLEIFLREYQDGKELIEKFKISSNDLPIKDYKEYQYQLILAKNIGDSELVVKTEHIVALSNGNEKLYRYKVFQTFTRFTTPQLIFKKKDFEKGIWTMDWIEM